MYEGSCLSTSSPMLVILDCFDCSHTSVCKVVLFVVWDCISLIASDANPVLGVHLDFLCWGMLNQLLCLFLKNLFIILGTKFLSGMWFANIFPHSVDCRFTLLIMSFNASAFSLKFNFSCIDIKFKNLLPIIYNSYLNFMSRGSSVLLAKARISFSALGGKETPVFFL